MTQTVTHLSKQSCIFVRGCSSRAVCKNNNYYYYFVCMWLLLLCIMYCTYIYVIMLYWISSYDYFYLNFRIVYNDLFCNISENSRLAHTIANKKQSRVNVISTQETREQFIFKFNFNISCFNLEHHVNYAI
jgi:hypothetical protein